MNENMTKLVSVTLPDGMEEGRRFSNEEKNAMISQHVSIFILK